MTLGQGGSGREIYRTHVNYVNMIQNFNVKERIIVLGKAPFQEATFKCYSRVIKDLQNLCKLFSYVSIERGSQT